MTIWVGDSTSTRRQIVDPWVGTSTGRKQVQQIWAGDATGQRQLVFIRVQPSVLTATAGGWDHVNLSWTSGGTTGVQSYRLWYGGTLLSDNLNLSYPHSLLWPSSTYNYTLETIVNGAVMYSTTASATTPAREDMGLEATASAWNKIDVSWTDPSGGADYYNVYDHQGNHRHGAAATTKSFVHTVGASQAWGYTLYAYRNNIQLPITDYDDAATPARTYTTHVYTAYASSCASYTGDPNWTPKLSTNAEMQHGDKTGDGTAGADKANARVSAWVCTDIPANLRSCKAVTKVEMQFRVTYCPNGNGSWGVGVTNQGNSNTWPAKWPGSTQRFGEYTHTGAHSWLGRPANSTSGWVDITTKVPSGGTRNIAEEFRVGGKWGLALIPNGHATNKYGHAHYSKTTSATMRPALRFTYQVWDS